jgi:hypothetical protein
MRAKIQSIEGQLHTIVQTQAQMCLHAKLRPPVSQHVLRIPSHSRGSRVIGPKSKKPKSIILGNLTIPEPHSRYYDPNPSLSSSVRNTSHFIVAPLNIAIYEQDDHTILLDSGNSPLASAARTLILMGDYLLSTLQNLPSSSQKTITKNHAFQLEAIFNFLLASCHVASAKSILCRYNPDRTRSDHTIQELQTIAKSSFGFGKTIREVSCCHGGRHHSLITPLGSIETDFITMGGDLTSDDSIVAAMTSNFFPSETR